VEACHVAFDSEARLGLADPEGALAVEARHVAFDIEVRLGPADPEAALAVEVGQNIVLWVCQHPRRSSVATLPRISKSSLQQARPGSPLQHSLAQAAASSA